MKAKQFAKQACFVSVVVGLCVSAAQARPIRIDQTDFNFENGGQDWGNPAWLTEGATLRTLPFSLTIGSDSFSEICISERGVVWFGNSSCSNPGSLEDLTGSPHISPLFDPSLTLNDSLDGPGPVTVDRAVTATSGYMNPFDKPYVVEGTAYYCSEEFYEGSSSFDNPACASAEIANGNSLESYRVNWSFDLENDFSLETFQLVFVDMSSFGAAGDFDLEMNYQGNFTDLHTPVLALGGTPLTFAISDLDNPVFQFRSGLLVTDEPTPVPEPGTWALLAAGLAGIFTLGFSRRRQMARRRA